jgi:hypothetical protein
MNLTATIGPSKMVPETHHFMIMYDGNIITQAHLTLDELEDIEMSLTDIIIDISRYRRKLQREEL